MIPRFKLYNSTGTVLLHTFEIVQTTNAPQSKNSFVEVKGQRGKGSIVIGGGLEAWDLTFEGVLAGSTGDDYEELTAKIDAMETALAFNTPYIFRIDKTASTTYEYKVKRLQPIEYLPGLRLNIQRYRIILRVNSW